MIDRLRHAAAAHPRQTDLAIALLLFAAAVASGLLTGVDREASVAPGVTWPQVPLLALMTLPLIWRRDHPLAVLLTIVAGTVGTGLFGFSTGAAAFAIVLALASASYYRGRTTTVVGSIVGAATIVGLYLGVSAPDDSASSTNIAFNVAVIVLAFVTGDVLRGHRQALAALAERNRRLERLRDVEKREAVTQDRMRIARELHDIVGHALAAVTLQARAGQRLAARDADAARVAFEQIEEVASRALGETREAVGVLRSGAERAELRPQPTLDDLPELVRAVTTPEVRVTLRRDVAVGAALPPAVQASAYRIVQESLANVVKHAGPAAAVVTVAAAAGGGLRVEVRDDGRGGGREVGGGADACGGGAAARAGGSGIGGMRARADQLGGSLAAGPAPGGGWLVAAELPGARR